jgi:hypothetical protein
VRPIGGEPKVSPLGGVGVDTLAVRETHEKSRVTALSAERVRADPLPIAIEPSEEQEGVAFQHAPPLLVKNAYVNSGNDSIGLADFPL